MGYEEDREFVERRCATEWSDRISWEKATAWLQQFAPSDRRYAIKMLKHFQFYSYGKVLDLLAVLHTTLLKERLLSSRFAAGEGVPEERDAAYRAELRTSLFLPVTSTVAPKSGDQLIYMYKGSNNLPGNLFTSLDHLPNQLTNGSVKTLILVDDFLGTGQQALSFYNEHLGPLLQTKPGVAVYLVVCVALADGITYLETHSPVQVVAGEVLDDSARAFSPRSRVFENLDRKKAQTVIEAYGALLNPYYPLGFAHCQLLVGFHWFPPDNTVTPIWWPHSVGWAPVFPRPKEEEI